MLSVKMFCHIVSIALCLSFVQMLFAGEAKQPRQKTPSRILAPTNAMKLTARTAVYLLSNEHFLQHKVDETFSAKLFDEYFKMLDPSRIYFTRKDIERFLPQRKILGQQLRRGNVDFAFQVFNFFLKRLDEYEKFTIAYLKTKPSLNGSDSYAYNRSKVPWEVNESALKEVWKKKIRNDLILFELLDRGRKQEQAEKKRKAQAKKKSSSSVAVAGKAPVKVREKAPAVKVKAPAVLTAEQRTIKRLSRFLQHYRTLDSQDVLELYLSTLSGVYDPHSAYMSPRTEENFNINMRLSLVGIGAVLTSEDGYTKIVRIIPGGPADKDKRLKAEDRIIAVTQEHGDPVDIMDMPLNKVVTMIRGKENTKVTLTILESSKGSSAVPVNITITRAKVPLKDSEVSGKLEKVILHGRQRRIGVISVPSFYIDFAAAYRGDPDYKSSTRDVVRAYQNLIKSGPLDGLVIDLRSNGGGSLLEAVTLSGLFIPEGPVVQVRSYRSNRINADQDGGKVLYRGPLAVVTNRFSASAAEIFAGAMQDYKRAVILGDAKTHGKGSVQTLIELDRYTSFLGSRTPSGSIKLTNAKFYRVNGASTQLRGVTPDIVFPSFTDAMEVGEDKLDHALKWDSVPAAQYSPYHLNFDPFLSTLRKRSAKRIAASKRFQLLKKDIAVLRQLQQRKNVILNLETRWREYLTEKKLQEEQKQLLRTDPEEGPVKSGSTLKNDLYLQETMEVLGDWMKFASPYRIGLKQR